MTSTEDTSVIVDHQAHWYSRLYVEALTGRHGYPKAERAVGGGYVLLADNGVTGQVGVQALDARPQGK